MSENILKTRISLRRDTEENWDLIKDTFTPLLGEICFVDTSNSLRAKVGDGVKTYAQLPFTDEDILDKINNIVVRGYYFNNDFYEDTTYTKLLAKSLSKIYIDNITRVIFTYDGTNWVSVNDTLPTASDSILGIMKLYGTEGQNTDGTMTQKIITDSIDEIEFAVDENDNECLILTKPW